jgi:hypothetical protein
MRRLSIVHIVVVIGALMFCTLKAQTYTVGDTVDNFGATVCVNDSGEWNYNAEGLGKVTWINLFTSW